MTAEDKVIEYELQIRDMLYALQERLDEFAVKKLDDFELGQKLAYTEILDIIKTRHQMILEILNEE